MPYYRDAAGNVQFERWPPAGVEILADDHPDVLALPALRAAELLAGQRLAAKAVFADLDADPQSLSRACRAFALLVLDELNAHAAKINAILTAIDSGSTLAQVKANVAAIADYPTRTAAQLRSAIRAKVDEE